MEDICTLCEPYPIGTPLSTASTSSSQTPAETPVRDVTIYPMKIIKKKARVETDVVFVVEWAKTREERHKNGKAKKEKNRQENGDRWFLLARRPEKGTHLVWCLSV